MFALGTEGGAVRQFVSASDEAEALTHAMPGEVAVAFAGEIKTGGLIQDGAVIFPAKTADQVLKEKWDGVRAKRLALFAQYDWTVSRANPLTEACKASWAAWFAAMDRITVDFSDPDAVTWPAVPKLEYSS